MTLELPVRCFVIPRLGEVTHTGESESHSIRNTDTEGVPQTERCNSSLGLERDPDQGRTKTYTQFGVPLIST